MISRSESRSPSISAASSAPVRSSRGLRRPAAIISVKYWSIRSAASTAAGGMPRTPSSRCTTWSAQARSVGAVRGRHAEQLADHVHRELAGEVRDEVAAAPLRGSASRCSRAIAPDPRLELRHAARREAARDQRAHARVPRRIHREERHGGVGVRVEDVLIEGDAVPAREGLRVLEGGEHVRVARERPEAERVVAVDGRLVAQRAVDGVGVLVDLVGVGVVLDHACLAASPHSITFT